MAKALKYFIAALVLLVVLALAVPLFIPADAYKDQIVAAVERSTGRTLTINGDLDLRFRPGLEFSIQDATLSNAPGATDPLMAQMDSMTIGVDWRALFSRKITITKFILEDPVISLEIMKNGKANWEFMPDAQPAAQEGGEANDVSSDTVTGNLDALSFGDLKIVNGQLTWRNHLAGQIYEISNVNLKVELPDLKGPVKIAGDLIYNSEKFDLDLALGSLAAITSGAQTTFGLDLKSQLIKAKLDGTLTGGQDTTIKSHARVDVPSVRKLAAWTGAPVASEKGFGPFIIEGDLNAAGPIYSFTGAKVTFDNMKADGTLKFNTANTKPVVSGTLTVDRIDLRPYMTETEDTDEDTGEQEELKWDDTPIDASGLRSLDVDFILKANALYFQGYEIGNTELSIRVHNNTLTATLDKMDLYKGTGKGAVAFNVNQPAAKVDASFSFVGIQAGSLVQAAADRDVVEGIGDFKFAVKTSGKSQNELMHGLSGNGALTLRDGKLKGVNLNRMLQIISAFTPDQAADATATQEGETQTAAETGSGTSTDFVEMGGTFIITGGVLRTKDFALINDALSLSGQGQVGIGKQTINMKLAPGRRADDGGTRLKMKVQGPWNNIHYGPDFEDVIKGGLRDILSGDRKKEEGQADKDPGGEIVDQLLDSIFGPKGN